MTTKRATLAVLAYMALRVALVAGITPAEHPDTDGYRSGISLIGGAPRTFVYPVVLAMFDNRTLVIFQALVSAVAFIVFAVAVASTMTDRRVRYGTIAVILAFSLASRMTSWDAMVLTESLTVSLTALLVAGLIWYDRVPTWAFCSVFFVWLFLRDGHLMTGALLTVGLGVHAYRSRRFVIPAVCLVLVVWAGLAQRHDPYVEGFTAALNISYRVDNDPAAGFWFLDHGMPDSDVFSPKGFDDEYPALYDDPEFREWAQTDGPTTYLRFIASRPDIAVQGFERLLIDGDEGDEALVDDTSYRLVHPIGVPIWPNEASWFTFLLGAAALLGSLGVANKQLIDRRWVLPAILASSAVPLGFVAYHATLIEFGRHGLLLSFLLVMSCLWMLALCVDSVISADGPAVADADDNLSDDVPGDPPGVLGPERHELNGDTDSQPSRDPAVIH